MRNRTFGMLAAIGALAVTASLTGTAGAGQAAPSAQSMHAAEARAAGLSAGQAAQLQERVDAHLAKVKVPAQQVSYNEIQTNDGATITLSSPGAAADTSCSYEYLCLWTLDDWEGTKLSFSTCALRDLNNYAFNNDTLTSYKNNQTRGTKAKFYNWDGAWVYKFDSTAPHTEDDLSNTSWNNMIDGVRVC